MRLRNLELMFTNLVLQGTVGSLLRSPVVGADCFVSCFWQLAPSTLRGMSLAYMDCVSEVLVLLPLHSHSGRTQAVCALPPSLL